MDLDKLTADCQAAKAAAVEADRVADDGGSCNLDATFLHLEKGVHSQRVISAIQAGGLPAFQTRWMGMRGLMISPPTNGQAGRRYACNEALKDSLKAAGWDVSGYYRMD